MRKHRFAVGDKVIVKRTQHNAHVPSGVFTITRLMPLSRADFEYRAKSGTDDHERVLREAEIDAANR